MEQEQDAPTVGNLFRKRGLMDEWNYFSGRHFSVFAADNFAYYEAVGWAALISFCPVSGFTFWLRIIPLRLEK